MATCVIPADSDGCDLARFPSPHNDQTELDNYLILLVQTRSGFLSIAYGQLIRLHPKTFNGQMKSATSNAASEMAGKSKPLCGNGGEGWEMKVGDEG